MTVTNEPGYYEDGAFGIRIENILIVKEVKTDFNFGGKPYYGFENVTVVPLCRNLIDTSLLGPEEKLWINTYHKECYDKVYPLLDKNGLAAKYLKRETQPF